MKRRELPERRYTDEEMRRIFEEASTAETRPPSTSDAVTGHTLDEMREIAREVGIDPAGIDRAAANLDAPVLDEPAPSLLGLTRTIHADRIISRRLDDDEMRRIARRTEQVVDRVGRIRQRGDWLEWFDPRERLYIAIVRDSARTRLHVIADHTREVISTGVVAGAAALLTLSFTARAIPVSTGTVLTLLAAGVAWQLARLFWRWRSATARDTLEELLDLLEDAVPTV